MRTSTAAHTKRSVPAFDMLEFKDEFDEGRPVDWKKGGKGIDIRTHMEKRLALEIS